MKQVFTRAALRQACFGLITVALSLPLLWTLHRRVGVNAPSTGSVLLLGTSVVVAFVGGGVLGAALHEFGRGTKFGRNRAGGWIAASGERRIDFRCFLWHRGRFDLWAIHC